MTRLCGKFMVQPNANLIRHLLAQGQTRSACDMAERWVRQQPEELEALFVLASVHMRLNDYPSAEPLLERCFSLRPDDLGVIRALMWTFRRQAKTAQAAEVCARAIRQLGELPELLLLKASLLDDQREYGEVMAVTNRLMERGVLNGEVAHLRVRALHRLNRSDEASALAQSFAKDEQHPAPERRTLWLEMSKIADEAGRHEEAMLATQSAHALHPTDILSPEI
jgi:Tfp pilus assembly protein PilF